MTHQPAIATKLDTPLWRQRPQPGPVRRTGVRVGVLVTAAGKVVVARVGVAALAIVPIIRQRVVVVTLEALDPAVPQKRVNTVRMRAESAEVAQTIDGVDAAFPHGAQRCFQSEIVVVDPPEDGDALHRYPLRLRRAEGVTPLYCAESRQHVQGK